MALQLPEAAADAVLCLDAGGAITYVDDAACHMLGYSRGELLHMAVRDLDPNCSPERWAEHWCELKARGSVTVASTYVTKSGATIDVEATVIYLQIGAAEYANAIVRDVSKRRRTLRTSERAHGGWERQGTDRTSELRNVGERLEREIAERLEAEAGLARSNDLVQCVLDASPDSIFVKDHEHRFLFVNEAFARIRGVRPQDMIGCPDTDFWPAELCFGNPTKGIRGFHVDDDEVLAGRSVHDPSCPSMHADGTMRYFDVIKLPLVDPKGEVYGVLAYARDLTDRRRQEEELRCARVQLEQEVEERTANLRASESRLRALVEASPEGVMVIQRGDRIDYVNDVGARLLGGARVEDIVGRSPLDFVHPDSRESAQRRIATLMAAERPSSMVEDRYVRLDGSVIDVEVATFPWNDRGAGAVCMVFRDISDRKRTEAERVVLFEESRQREERLALATRRLIDVQETERRHLSRELHDEIGQLLTALKISIAGEFPEAAATREALDIVEILLDRARAIAVGLRPPLLDELGLGPALREHVTSLGRRAETTFTIAVDLDGFEPPPDVALACYRVMQEALTNVVRHAHAAHAEVVVRRDVRGLHLEIRDDGCGFDPQGAGGHLGMTVMRERVELLGGELTMTSRRGEGTAVHAFFPRVPSARLELPPDHR